MVVRVNGSTGIVTVSGTSGAPSLRGPDGTTGISFDGDQVIISSSGLVAATFSNSAATFTNQSFSPGSSGTPTVAPSGDLNTGIYFPAADTIGFAEGGNEAGRFDSSGRFLVSTTSAPTTPNGSLQFAVESPTTFTTSVFVSNANSANGAYIALQHGRGGTADSDTIVQSGDDLGGIQFVGADGTTTRREAATIKGQVDGTPGSADMPGRLVFSTTADGASSPTEAMRLDSSQNLRFNSGYGSVATAYGVRAWVNFNGSTMSIRGSGNISSITDNGTGDYTLNFSTSFPDTNYAPSGSCRSPGTMVGLVPQFDVWNTGSLRFYTYNTTPTGYDQTQIAVAIYR